MATADPGMRGNGAEGAGQRAGRVMGIWSLSKAILDSHGVVVGVMKWTPLRKVPFARGSPGAIGCDSGLNTTAATRDSYASSIRSRELQRVPTEKMENQ